MTKPFVLLDRDGTLTIEREYLSDPNQLALIPGAAGGVRRLRELGCGVVVVTNQSGVGRGMFTAEDVDRVNDRLRELLAAEGLTLDGIYVCPHVDEDLCDCRKPRPGLVAKAVAQWSFDPRASFVVGDKASDVELGQNVGAKTILVRTGYGPATEASGKAQPDYVANDLAAAAEIIARILMTNDEIRMSKE